MRHKNWFYNEETWWNIDNFISMTVSYQGKEWTKPYFIIAKDKKGNEWVLGKLLDQESAEAVLDAIMGIE